MVVVRILIGIVILGLSSIILGYIDEKIGLDKIILGAIGISLGLSFLYCIGSLFI